MKNNDFRPLSAIVGPTASGKTVLGHQLAREQNGEIISVDSRQIYKRLAVGTAKPVGEWTSPSTYLVEGIAYHLVDILEPTETFSAADFQKRVLLLLTEIVARGKMPILVGGTGFYFRALTHGIAPLPVADPDVRSRLNAEAAAIGRPALHARLKTIDPEAAAKIPANNIQRLIRALEVFELTGKPLSVWHQEHQARPSTGIRLAYQVIDPGIPALTERITERCRMMLERGMIEETQALLQSGVPHDCPGLSGLGYPRVLEHLAGRLSRDELLRLLIQDTRQYAKRQRTWFRTQISS